MRYRRILLCCLSVFLILFLACSVTAHPGKTDSNGGHTDHGSGDYHYHHGYPAHDHYDMDGDGKKDCPYDFDDKTGESSGNTDYNSSSYPYLHDYPAHNHFDIDGDGIRDCPYDFGGRPENGNINPSSDSIANEEENKLDSEDDDPKTFKSYLNTFLISLVSSIIAALIWFFIDEYDIRSYSRILNYLLIVLLVIFGVIGLYAVGVIAIFVFLIHMIYAQISGGIRDRRIKRCEEYATLLIGTIESQNLKSCAQYLLWELNKKIYSNPKLYKKPYEIKVQKTLYEIASFKIECCNKPEDQATAQYIQLQIIKEKLLTMLQINGVEI